MEGINLSVACMTGNVAVPQTLFDEKKQKVFCRSFIKSVFEVVQRVFRKV